MRLKFSYVPFVEEEDAELNEPERATAVAILRKAREWLLPGVPGEVVKALLAPLLRPSPSWITGRMGKDERRHISGDCC